MGDVRRISEGDIAPAAKELIAGNVPKAISVAAGIAGTFYLGPLGGAVAAGLVDQVARLVVDNATKRFLSAGATWEAEQEHIDRLGRYLATELEGYLARLSELIQSSDQAQRNDFLGLASQSEEHFQQLVLFIHRNVPTQESQSRILEEQLSTREQLADLMTLLREVATATHPRSMAFDPEDKILDETVDLNRLFFELPKAAKDTDPEQWLRVSRALQRGKAWSEILLRKYVVVLGEAGSGKTIEFRRQAAALRRAGLYGFFVNLSELSDAGLQVTPTLGSWKATTAEGYFFLDSLDEAKLYRGSLTKALRNLQLGLGDLWTRVRIVVSCRASDWNISGDAASLRAVIPPDSEDIPYVVQLGPLERQQVRTLASHAGVTDLTGFWKDVEDRQAEAFVERPLDVRWMAAHWQRRGHIGTLTELLEENLHQKLKESPNRDTSLTNSTAEQGAMTLAGIATLMRCHSFAVPDDGIQVPDASGTLDPHDVVRDWAPPLIHELLRRPIFDESSYGRVRFHHRMVQEFLAAKWLNSLVENGLSESALHAVLFRSDGKALVAPQHLAPIVGWLSIWNGSIRATAIREAPALLLTHGDPSQLDLATRVAILRAYTDSFIDRGRHFAHLDRSTLKRFVVPELGETIRGLLSASHSKPELASTLLDLVELGRLEACTAEALNILGDTQCSVEVRAASVSAVAASGGVDSIATLRSMVAAIIPCPHEITAELIRSLYPRALGPVDLAKALEATVPPPSNFFGGLSTVVTYEVPEAGDPGTRIQLLEAILPIVARERSGEVRQVDRAREWLLPLVANLLTSILRDVPSASELAPLVGETLDLLNHSTPTHRTHALDLQAISSALSRHSDLRQSLFWRHAAAQSKRNGSTPTRARELRLGRAGLTLSGLDSEWLARDARTRPEVRERLLAFDTLSTLRNVEDENRRATLVRELASTDRAFQKRLARMHNRPHEDDASDHVDVLQQRAAEIKSSRIIRENKRFLEENLAEIRSGQKLGLLWFLYTECESGSTWGDVSMARLRDRYGDVIAEAAQAGWINFWRTYQPPFPNEERDPSGTSRGTMVGLAGLNCEIRNGLDVASLDEANTITAIRYAVSESNEFPSWLSDITRHKQGVIAETLRVPIGAEYATDMTRTGRELLSKLGTASDELKRACAPLLLRLLLDRDSPRTETLRRSLGVVAATQMQVPLTTCEQRCAAAITDPERFALWWGYWIEQDSASAIAFLTHQLTQAEPDLRRRLIEQICVDLDFEGDLLREPRTKLRVSGHALSNLIPIIYEHFPPRTDPKRRDDSARPRDHAQEVRHRLVRWLSEIPGDQTIHDLRRLAHDPRLADHHDWLLHLADERREVSPRPAPS